MNMQKRNMFVIKFAYWLGIAADGFWAVVLLIPPVFGIITGRPDFNPDMQFRTVLGIAGTLMTGWTCLLIWGVRKPIERRFVILLTAFPVVLGIFIVALIAFLNGNTSNLWILVKCALLMISMVTSYILAGKIDKI